MITLEEAGMIASKLPGAAVHPDGCSFFVMKGDKTKGFAWVWMERVEPQKPKVPRLDILAVRVQNEAEKQMLLEADPVKFFTEPHYNGFPAILVRLTEIDPDELSELLTDAWACIVPARLRNSYLASLS